MRNTISNPHALELLRLAGIHRRQSEELARATGEHFNIFRILGVGHLEMMHSRILGELLDPRGCHCQRATFLRLFLTRFNITNFDTGSESATVELEYYAGPVTEKSGGRIDIVLKDGRGATIFIENKVFAAEGENQIKRYLARHPSALVYLTREGIRPSNLSRDDLKRVECISYKKDILAWLEDCRKEAACVPAVREAISQYIHLVRELTNQSILTPMNEKLIKEILGSPESLAAFFTLHGVYESVCDKLIAQLDEQLDEIAKAMKLDREGQLRELHIEDSGFFFRTAGLDKSNLKIGFGFATKGYRDFWFGFGTRNPEQGCPVKKQLLAAFTETFPEFPPDTPNPYSPASAYWEDPYRYWEREAFEAILSKKFQENLREKLEKLAKIARQLCPD